MWRIQNPTIRKKKLDFSSSGQKDREVSQLICDNTILLNAVELIDFDDEQIQVLVCEKCGYPGCEPGNWIALRRAGKFIFMVPSYEAIESDSEGEYTSPRYLRKLGAPYFDIDEYESLVQGGVGIPSIDKIRALRMNEAMRLVQSETPYRLFGEPSFVELSRDKKSLVIAASEGEHQEYLRIVREILEHHYDDRRDALLKPLDTDANIIHLFIDGAEFIDWKALVDNAGKFNLILGNELKVGIANA